MLVLNCEQGSREWIEARLGIPTASQFSRIVTPTGQAIKARDGYLAELLCEWVMGEQMTDFKANGWSGVRPLRVRRLITLRLRRI